MIIKKVRHSRNTRKSKLQFFIKNKIGLKNHEISRFKAKFANRFRICYSSTLRGIQFPTWMDVLVVTSGGDRWLSENWIFAHGRAGIVTFLQVTVRGAVIATHRIPIVYHLRSLSESRHADECQHIFYPRQKYSRGNKWCTEADIESHNDRWNVKADTIDYVKGRWECIFSSYEIIRDLSGCQWSGVVSSLLFLIFDFVSEKLFEIRVEKCKNVKTRCVMYIYVFVDEINSFLV